MADETQDSKKLDHLQYRLEVARFRAELGKWAILAVGAVVSFYLLDLGKLNLEQARFRAETKRQLLDAYFRASESPQPEVWKRKLYILENIADDESTKKWAHRELEFVREFAELNTLYRETLNTACQLTDRRRLKEPARIRARARYEQLYWADLPFAKESQEVESAMVEFRSRLIEAENSPDDAVRWDELNSHLLRLSRALRNSTPQYPPP